MKILDLGSDETLKSKGASGEKTHESTVTSRSDQDQDFGSILHSEIKKKVIHAVVRYQMAKRRSGTHKAKGRSEVNASTRKIYKQKGTGGARHGAISAPQFVGGGVAFGPVVRSHAFKLNKKVRNLGLKSALSQRYKENNLFVIDSFDAYQSNKVKDFISFFAKSDLYKNSLDINKDSVLLVDTTINEQLSLSTSNLPNVNTLPAVGVNVVDILRHSKVVITIDAIKKIHARVSK